MKRAVKKIVTVILCIVMFVSSAAGITMMIVDNTLDPTGKIGLSVADPEYGDKMYSAVIEALNKKMALVAITYDDISDIVNEEAVRDAAPEASVMLAKRLLGSDDVQWRYESKALRERITEVLGAYAEEHGIEYEDSSADEVYEMVCDTVSAELNVVPANYSAKVSPIFAKIRAICEFWSIPAIMFLVSCVAVLVLGKRHLKRTVYNILVPSYFSAFAVYAVSAILYSKDYLATTVLGDGMLQYYIRGMYNGILSELKQISGVFTLVYLFMSVLVIVAIAMEQKKKRKHKHRSGGSAEGKRHGNGDVKISEPREEMPVEDILRRNEDHKDAPAAEE